MQLTSVFINIFFLVQHLCVVNKTDIQYTLTMIGLGRASSTHTELSGRPNKQPWAAPVRDSSLR